MGNEEQYAKSFGLRDLGVLDGPPEKGFDVVVRLVASALNAPMVALMMFDDECASIFLRASFGLSKHINPLIGFPVSGSIASVIRAENRSLLINDLEHSEVTHSVEVIFFSAASCLGTPVHGCAGEPIGVLTVMQKSPRAWTNAQAESLEDFAYLTSQQIMLKASFETLRLMKRQTRTLMI